MRTTIQRIREWFKRITGISTPVFGLSWTPAESSNSSTENLNSRLILTVDECARILRVERQLVVGLLESGELVGLLIRNEWRVTPHQLQEFLIEQTNATQLEVLSNQLQNPRVWARELANHPEFKKQIESETYGENTFGRFLQDASALIETPVASN